MKGVALAIVGLIVAAVVVFTVLHWKEEHRSVRPVGRVLVQVERSEMANFLAQFNPAEGVLEGCQVEEVRGTDLMEIQVSGRPDMSNQERVDHIGLVMQQWGDQPPAGNPNRSERLMIHEMSVHRR